MAVSDFRTPELWRKDLDQRWPERIAFKQIIRDKLVERLQGKSDTQILELGLGDGELLAELAASLTRSKMVAMDINQSLLTYCQSRLSAFHISFVSQDLCVPWASGNENHFDAVYSLQSIHDFGGLDALTQTYQQIAQVLKPGGLVLNADFILPMPQDDPAAPRRFPVEVHTQLLTDCGFENIRILHQEGLLGCLMANLPDPNKKFS